MRNRRTVTLLGVMALLSSLLAVGPVSAAPSKQGCESHNLNTIDKMLTCVNADDALEHLEVLQSIADANNGTRASGTPGYDASADYVAGLLQDAGLTVERQTFEITSYVENSSSLSLGGSPLPTETFEYSGSGTVTGGVPVAVNLDLGLGNSSVSGCSAADFVGLDFSGSADVAIIQRGACNFSEKAFNAEEAGAEAVVIFNQGNTADRTGPINGTLGSPVVSIPVLDATYADGVALATASGGIDLAADTTITIGTTENVIAEIPGETDDNVVMAGAHLDSVAAGPGIQDNGSGSAAILAVALAMANNKKYVPHNTLRFAWWGAEESGLIGSFEYFTNADFGLLSTAPEEVDRIAAYLNFDMIASPNAIYGVYDADQSTFPAPVPVPIGSAELEDLFEAYYSINGIPYEDSAFSGRSDYQVFILLDIPSSGLFTGAEGIKTPEQAAIWGGTAGDQYDPCYHLACDTIDNVGRAPLEVNVDAVAYAIFNLAGSTETVNGVAGSPVIGVTPDEVTLDGPQGTFLGGGGFTKHAHAES